jgi:hypothetical protein
VWSKLGWDKDGLGKDPWNGRLDHNEMPQISNVELEVGSEPANVPRPDSMDQGHKGDREKGSDTTTMETEGLWDGDPLDMMQWDEWDELTHGIFVS